MRILFIGDIFGELGLSLLSDVLPRLKDKLKPDFIIANGENSVRNGRGMDRKAANQIWMTGVNCITLGNHTWKNNDIFQLLEQDSRIVRPANFPSHSPGQTVALFNNSYGKIAVISLLGRTFVTPTVDCPFSTVDQLLASIPDETIIIVDVHAETTSEKLALAWYLDGRVAAVVGTHTHVQTADERILSKGTGYLTDAGMVGPYDGVIGLEREGIIYRYRTQLPSRSVVAKGRGQFNAVVFDIDAKKGITTEVSRIRIDDDNPLLE